MIEDEINSANQKPRKRKLPLVKWLFVILAVLASGSIIPTAYALFTGGSDEAVGAIIVICMVLAGLAICLTAWILIIVDLAVGKKRNWSKVGSILLLLILPIVCIGVFLGAGQVAYTHYQPALAAQQKLEDEETKKAAKPNVHQDEKLVAVLKSVGAKDDYADLNLRWGTASQMMKLCGWADAGGCYDGEATIYVNSDTELSYQKTIVAHEYLHYVWYKQNLDDDRQLTSALTHLYGRSPHLQQRMNEGTEHQYLNSGGLQPTEFFAFGCTEISDIQLGQYIAGWCNRFIDTSALTALY